MCFICLIPYVLKKTMMISAQSPKINPPGGCQSFCFGFWKKENQAKIKTKNLCLVFTFHGCCVYHVQKKMKSLAVEKNTNKPHFQSRSTIVDVPERLMGGWAATQVKYREKATRTVPETPLRQSLSTLWDTLKLICLDRISHIWTHGKTREKCCMKNSSYK